MRKVPVIMSVLLICLVIVTLGCVALGSTQKQTYATTAVVVSCNKETDIVICEDYNGELWEFFGVEDWQKNDVITLTMDTCGTDKVYDDKIVSTRYSGNTEGWSFLARK